MDWSSVFDKSRPARAASAADVNRFMSSIGQPLTPQEVADVNRTQRNPFPTSDPLHAGYRPFDPSLWVLPQRPLPADYLSFLRWSNGGWCRTDDREFGFFPTEPSTGGIRAMLLAYHVTQYMPGALPFAFNGGGTFYLFDMREQAEGDSYQVVCARAGALGWGPQEHWVIADSFEAACRGSFNVDDMRESAAGPDVDPAERVAIYLEQPLKSPRTLLTIKEHLGLATSIADLKRMAEAVPCCIDTGPTYMQAIKRCARVNAIEPCLGIRLLSDRTVSLPLDYHA